MKIAYCDMCEHDRVTVPKSKTGGGPRSQMARVFRLHRTRHGKRCAGSFRPVTGGLRDVVAGPEVPFRT